MYRWFHKLDRVSGLNLRITFYAAKNQAYEHIKYFDRDQILRHRGRLSSLASQRYFPCIVPVKFCQHG